MISPSIQQQRELILQQIGQIDSIIRGHLSQQTLKPKRASGSPAYGPYYTLQRHENGANNCQRISPAELEFISEGVLGHARFMELTRRYAELTEQLTWEHQSAQVKKNSSVSGDALPANRPLPPQTLGRWREELCRFGAGLPLGTQARRSAVVGAMP
jgi:hypothetical protein